MFLIFALVVAYYMTRNTVQDLAWKARGQDPPSFRREQDRIARKAKRRPITGRQEARKFWATAWADAWESANERREHAREKAKQRRQKAWVDQDEDEARYINDRMQPSDGGSPAEDVVHDPWGPCQICHRRVPPEQLTTRMNESRTTPAAVTVCPSCADTIDNHRRQAGGEPPRPNRGAAPSPSDHPNGDGQPAEPETATPSTDATVVDMQKWRTPTQQEDNVNNASGETTNLTAALAFADGMSKSCGDGATSTETSIAALQAGDVSGPVIGHFTRGQELLTQARAEFSAGHADLTSQMAVKDAYAANQGAGSKEFVTQD